MSLYKNRIPDLRWKKFRFAVDPRYVNKSITASIFWGFYEGAEIRLIEKYLDGASDVIELGGSIGVVSSHILKKIKRGKKLITVEANPMLLQVINENLRRHKAADSEFKILNKAISYRSEEVFINITDNNTESTISSEKGTVKTGIPVAATTLTNIIREEQIADFALVSDIEGSEIEFLLKDGEALKKCRQLFIELHDTSYDGIDYSVDALKELLQTRHHFTLKDQHGPVCYFERKD